MFGRKFHTEDLKPANLAMLSTREKEKKIYKLAEYFVHVYTSLEYSIIPGYGPGDMGVFSRTGQLPEELTLFHKYLRELVGDTMMIEIGRAHV